MKGQAPVIGVIGIGVTIAIASVGGAFYQSNRVGAVETRTAVLETKFEAIQARLEKIDGNVEEIRRLIIQKK